MGEGTFQLAGGIWGIFIQPFRHRKRVQLHFESETASRQTDFQRRVPRLPQEI